MKSMTGYGEARVQAGGVDISVVIKAVNGRFFDPRLHLPKEYFQFESILKKQLASQFSRGTLEVYISRRSVTPTVRVNIEMAKSWLAAQKNLAKSLRLPLKQEIVLDRMLSMPQIWEQSEKEISLAQEKSALLKGIKNAIKQCDSERSREGLSLKSGLKSTLNELSGIVGQMAKLRKVVTEEIETRLKEKLKKMGLEKSVEPVRFAQELVLYLDRSDIAEELERLAEHLSMCEDYINTKDASGKKLDFYSQELLREVNTIGSKANSAPMTKLVVQAKGLIEAFKEQVQNIE